MPRLIAGILICAAGIGNSAWADDADAIRAELTKAKKAHSDADAKAKSALLTAIDDTIKTVAGAGDLDGVKALQTSKRAFQDDGKVPDSARLRTATAEFVRATKAAQATLEKAYDKAVKDATKGLNIDLAEAIQAEWKGTQAKSTGTRSTEKVDSPAARTKWVAGTYKITYTPNRSERTYVVRLNGDVATTEGKVMGQIKPSGSGLLLDFSDGRIERLTFADGRLFIEHFNPPDNLHKNFPDQVGIGEPVKKK